MVDIADKLGEVTDLTNISVDFRVLTEEEEIQQDWSPVNLKEGMRVFPLIDTTVGTWEEGTYKLYIRPSIGPESPVLGPMEFGLS